tara:strand:- start:60 stop:299 length:240 start_codon:yes stop_codon:yes gene_type:complete
MNQRSDLCESHGEEVANTISHGLGVIMGTFGLVIMVKLAIPFGAWHVSSVSIFGASLILLYLGSTLYHFVQSPRAKRVF